MKISKLLILIMTFVLYSSKANATLNITIKAENLSKTKILFIGFESNNFSLNNEAKQILQRIIYNLKTTNLVEPLVQEKISPSPINQKIADSSNNSQENNTPNADQNFSQSSLVGVFQDLNVCKIIREANRTDEDKCEVSC